MKFYPSGTTPPLPAWFTEGLRGTGMDARELPMWFIGGAADFSAPAAYRLAMPPNWVLCRHGHPCERLEIVIQGALEVGDGRIATVGDMFTAAANTLDGPGTRPDQRAARRLRSSARSKACSACFTRGPTAYCSRATSSRANCPRTTCRKSRQLYWSPHAAAGRGLDHIRRTTSQRRRRSGYVRFH